MITIILNYISTACSAGQKDLVYILKAYRYAEHYAEIFFQYAVSIICIIDAIHWCVGNYWAFRCISVSWINRKRGKFCRNWLKSVHGVFLSVFRHFAGVNMEFITLVSQSLFKMPLRQSWTKYMAQNEKCLWNSPFDVTSSHKPAIYPFNCHLAFKSVFPAYVTKSYNL